MLSDEMHDGLFQHRGGQSPAGEVLLATVLDEAPGDVVAEPLPVFLFGVARRQPVPGLVEELACQWGTGCTALRRASPWFGSPCLQLRLDRVPELRSNDRWMLALVDTPLVPDAAGVERIGQQAVEVSATERQPACPGSIRGEASLGAQSQTVRLGLHLPERSVLPVQRIERPDRFGLSLVDAQRAAKQKLEQAERNLTKAKETEKATKEKIDETNMALRKLEGELKDNERCLEALQKKISEVTRSPDPEAERDGLVGKITDLESEQKCAAEAVANTKNQLTAAEQALKLKTKAAKEAEEGAVQRQKTRDERVALAGFQNTRAIEEAVRNDEVQADLREKVQAHERELHTVEQRINTLKKELGTERVSKDQLENASKRATDLSEEVETVVGRGKKLEHQVESMKQRLKRSKELREELQAEEEGYRLYNHLAADLRSDKFQAYVLEEAFTELVRGASTRLLALTRERYSLEFAEDQIVVVDHDNAGETRISDTLSGGETFLTSLSLALELSEQVQRAAGAVNLDSLFIDEGFGTLDPDTLAVVSETIQSLQVGGRMVGIITHIPELRDEFSQQILVTKHEGYSTVEVRPRST